VLLQAGAVILGAFIGGGSAVVAGYFADRRRFKREDKYRDYGERRQAYAEFLASWNSVQGGSGVVSRNPFSKQPQEEIRKWAHETQLQLDKSFFVLDLIAPDAVREAAKSMLDEDEGYERFRAAARKDLDKLPRRRWWGFWH
jgi:hypothetical protein